METFREITRSFFSLFLLMTCFIGCGETLYWMQEMNLQVLAPTPRYSPSRYYDYEYDESVDKAVDELMNDTTTVEEEEYQSYDKNYLY